MLGIISRCLNVLIQPIIASSSIFDKSSFPCASIIVLLLLIVLFSVLLFVILLSLLVLFIVLDVDFLSTFQVNPTDSVDHIIRHIYDYIQTYKICEDTMMLISSFIQSSERLLVYDKELVLEPIQTYPFTT